MFCITYSIYNNFLLLLIYVKLFLFLFILINVENKYTYKYQKYLSNITRNDKKCQNKFRKINSQEIQKNKLKQ